MYVCKTVSPEKTFRLGAQLGGLMKAGDIICLAGNLGAGKTVFVKGIAEGLEAVDGVTSPTFTIMNVYEAGVPIYHFDLYRLEKAEELYDVGFYEYTGTDGVAVIEWPDKFPGQMPEERLWIDIKSGDDANERLFCFKPCGERYRQGGGELIVIADSGFRYSHPCV
jgi:tRNA threonylcarbamoyladenosine biosynthesis protein TsaE